MVLDKLISSMKLNPDEYDDYVDEYERILNHRNYEVNFSITVKKTMPLI